MSTTTETKKSVKRNAVMAAFFVAFGAVAVGTASPAAAIPDFPYGPDTCIAGFVWREAVPSDHVCVTPSVRSSTQQENANPALHRSPTGGPYGPDTCVQGFVWRDAWQGDHVCVTGAVRSQAATDNAAAASRKLANHPELWPAPPPPPPPPPPAPKQGPGVSFDPGLGVLTVHVQDRSGVAAQCTYKSQFSDRGFFLPANSTTDVRIAPAIRRFQDLNVTVSCDNGTSTQTSTFF